MPAGKSEVFHFDAHCPGLSVRIQRVGRPAFVVWYNAGGKRKRMALGAVGRIDLEEARRQAHEIARAAHDGRDPGKERAQSRAAAVVAAAPEYTVGDLIAEYLSEHAERHQRPRTLIETRRALERHWAPLHRMPVAAVTRQDVATRLRALAKSTGPVGANRARANLSAAFAWGIKAGAGPKGRPVESNPVYKTVNRFRQGGAKVRAKALGHRMDTKNEGDGGAPSPKSLIYGGLDGN